MHSLWRAAANCSRFEGPAALLLAMVLFARSQSAPKTVEERVAEFGTAVQSRLAPRFERAGVPYPPRALTLIGIKNERVLEVHAAGDDGAFHFVCTYPVLAASGRPGPKLREGDRQVPEGVYAIESLNPNSDFHLALRIDYPNEFDRARGTEDGRNDLGCDIMVHGNAVSIGCLAMGDEGAEDLFVLAALTGIENIRVILTPFDFRTEPSLRVPDDAPPWTAALYEQIKRELSIYSKQLAAEHE